MEFIGYIWATGDGQHYLEYSDNVCGSSEGLEKGYDRFQQLLSQLEAHGAEVSTEDANHKFNNLRVFEQEIQGAARKNISKCCKMLLLFHKQSRTNNVKDGFTGAVYMSTLAKHSEDWDLLLKISVNLMLGWPKAVSSARLILILDASTEDIMVSIESDHKGLAIELATKHLWGLTYVAWWRSYKSKVNSESKNNASSCDSKFSTLHHVTQFPVPCLLTQCIPSAIEDLMELTFEEPFSAHAQRFSPPQKSDLPGQGKLDVTLKRPEPEAQGRKKCKMNSSSLWYRTWAGYSLSETTVASQKPKSKDKGRRYKRRKESIGKKVATSLDFQEEVNTGSIKVSTVSEQVSTGSTKRIAEKILKNVAVKDLKRDNFEVIARSRNNFAEFFYNIFAGKLKVIVKSEDQEGI
ncbi:hypothetical protein Tco_0600489 [Tanacetum coccineum]|uniref:Uncharacterized protein n=1 Tax=Tanacetum coccineum TaxID=301880 RepID=A0ABQ4WC15_9ASTR